MTCIRIIEVLPAPDELFRAAAEEFVRIGRAAISERGRFTVAVPGVPGVPGAHQGTSRTAQRSRASGWHVRRRATRHRRATDAADRRTGSGHLHLVPARGHHHGHQASDR